MPNWVAILLLLVISYVMFLCLRVISRRKRNAKALANQLGMTYLPKVKRARGNEEVDQFRKIYEHARQNDAFVKAVHATNFVFGNYKDRWIAIFDARVGYGRNSKYFVCILTKTERDCPATVIQPHHLLEVAVGMSRVTLESNEFNETYSVFSKDGRFATALVSGSIMSYLLNIKKLFRPTIHLHHDVALFVFHDLMPASVWTNLADNAFGFLDTIPNVVAELYPKAG